MVMRAIRWVGLALLFGVAFVVNPAWVAGCVSSDEDDNVDKAAVEADLLESLDNFNGTGSWEFEQDGERYEVLLALSQEKGSDQSARAPERPSFMSVAHACGGITFYQSASACVTQYLLALEGTMTLRRLGMSPVTILSDVEVGGTLSNFDSVNVNFGDGYAVSFSRGSDESYVLDIFDGTNLGDDNLDLNFRANR